MKVTTIGNKILLGFLVVIFTIVFVSGVLSFSLRTVAARDFITGFFALLIGSILALVISRGITREVRSLAEATGVISQGDLTQDIKTSSEDEIGELAKAFNKMVYSLQELVKEVKATAEAVTKSAIALSSSAEEMNASTGEIASTVEQIAKGAEQQANSVEQASRLMREMANSINEIASRARSAAEAASEAGYTAQTGGKSAQEAMGKMKGVFDIIEASTAGVKRFSEKTQQIGSIVDVITKIAQQTHLLALNATIEAARAGEFGRGFAVVAEEVRKLATEAGSSAEKIAQIVKEIQGDSNRVLTSMEVATKEVESGKEILTCTGEALQEIVKAVLEEVKKVQEISILTQQQTRGAEEMVRTIDEIAKVAQDNAASTEEASAATAEQMASMEQMAESAQQLSEMADRLQGLVARFKVRD